MLNWNNPGEQVSHLSICIIFTLELNKKLLVVSEQCFNFMPEESGSGLLAYIKVSKYDPHSTDIVQPGSSPTKRS